MTVARWLELREAINDFLPYLLKNHTTLKQEFEDILSEAFLILVSKYGDAVTGDAHRIALPIVKLTALGLLQKGHFRFKHCSLSDIPELGHEPKVAPWLIDIWAVVDELNDNYRARIIADYKNEDETDGIGYKIRNERHRAKLQLRRKILNQAAAPEMITPQGPTC